MYLGNVSYADTSGFGAFTCCYHCLAKFVDVGNICLLLALIIFQLNSVAVVMGQNVFLL